MYNEKLRDLWDRDGDGVPDTIDADGAAAKPAAGKSAAAAAAAAGATGPRIRQTPAGEIVLDGTTRAPIRTYEALAKLLAEGGTRRTTAATKMNATSSRSHAVLTLHITVTDTDDTDGVNESRKAKLHLVDLAGSERADSTGATGAQLKEGAAINTSLSALGNVINALTAVPAAGAPAAAAAPTAGDKPAAGGAGTKPAAGAAAASSAAAAKPYIPYRDSVLTRLLQDSLGGNAYTLMLCCLSPASVNYAETLASLRFATRAKAIKTKVTRNVSAEDATINALRAENNAIEMLVAALEAACVTAGATIAAAAAVSATAVAPAKAAKPA